MAMIDAMTTGQLTTVGHLLAEWQRDGVSLGDAAATVAAELKARHVTHAEVVRQQVAMELPPPTRTACPGCGGPVKVMLLDNDLLVEACGRRNRRGGWNVCGWSHPLEGH